MAAFLGDNMRIVSAKKLQIVIEKIDEYNAKYRKMERSFGFHFSGHETQGWTGGQISNGMLFSFLGELTSPKFDEMVLYDNEELAIYNANQANRTAPAQIRPWSFPFKYLSVKLIVDPKELPCEVTISLTKSDDSTFSVPSMVRGQGEALLFIPIREEESAEDETYVNQITITTKSIETNTPCSFYLQYINLGNNKMIPFRGPINILDEKELEECLKTNLKEADKKFIFDKFSKEIQKIESAPSDNGCSTCDNYQCHCDGPRYQYNGCRADGCNGYTSCSCNASCHLQEVTRCLCDHMFYSVDVTDTKRSVSTPIAKDVDLLAKVKPTLENLYRIGDNTYKKINESKPGYLRYSFDTPYKLTKEENVDITTKNSADADILASKSIQAWSADILRDPRFQGSTYKFISVGNHNYFIVSQFTKGFPAEGYWFWDWDPKTQNYKYDDYGSMVFWEEDDDMGAAFHIVIYEIQPLGNSFHLEYKNKFGVDTYISQGEKRNKIKQGYCRIEVYETSISNGVLSHSIAVLLNHSQLANGLIGTWCFSLNENGAVSHIKQHYITNTWYRDYKKVIGCDEPFYFMGFGEAEEILSYSKNSSGQIRYLMSQHQIYDNPLQGIAYWDFKNFPAISEPLYSLRNGKFFLYGHAGYSHSALFPGATTDNTLSGSIYSTPLIAVRQANNINELLARTMNAPDVIFSLDEELEKDLTSVLKYYPDWNKQYYEKQYPLVRFSFVFTGANKQDTNSYDVDIIVNNKIYPCSDIFGINPSINKEEVIEMDPRCVICYTGCTKYPLDNGKFIIYRHYDGNTYLKGFNNNANDKGIKVGDIFNEGSYFMTLSSDGILSNGSATFNIKDSSELTNIKTGDVFDNLSIKLTNSITEFEDFSLKADSALFDENKANSGEQQCIPCLCDQKQYYTQACVCDSACDGYSRTCTCYSKSY